MLNSFINFGYQYENNSNLSGKSIEMAFPALGDLPQLAVL